MATKKHNVGNVPNLRFPEFQGEWENKRLGDVSKISSGGTPNRGNQEYWSGDIPWITTSLINFNIIDHAEEMITEQGLKNSSAKLYPIETVLMAMYGQGKTRGQVAMLGIEAATNQACAAIMTEPQFLIPQFLFQNLSKRYNEIRELSNQGGQENLSGAIIKAIELSFPSPKEQNKIADFISVIDTRIATQRKIISQLESLMKSLRENFFLLKIRFKNKNGSNYPDWEMKKLGDMGTFYSGGTPSTSRQDYFKGNIPFIRSGEINATSTEQFISNDGLRNSSAKMVYVGDIIYALYGATSGEVGISKIKGAINQAILCIRTSQNSIFLSNFLRFKKTAVLETYLQGGQGNLSAEIIKSIYVPIPDMQEQAHIASLLDAIDQKIATEKELLLQLYQQKRFLLADLFI